MFHQHKWVDESTTYNPPVTRHIKLDNCSEETFLQLLQGLTNIKQRCSECGKVAVVSTHGRVDDASN